MKQANLKEARHVKAYARQNGIAHYGARLRINVQKIKPRQESARMKITAIFWRENLLKHKPANMNQMQALHSQLLQ